MRFGLFAALALCACASTPDVSPSPADYGAMRFSEQASERAAFDELAAEAAQPPDFDWGPAVAEQPDCCTAAAIMQSRRAGWIRVAGDAADYAAWTTDAAALRERLAHVVRLEADYLEGREPDARYAINAETWSVARFSRARRTSEPRVQELLGRAIREQVARIVTFGETAEPFTAGLSETAKRHWPRVVTSRLAQIDCSNTAWLRQQVRQHGWFDISRYGAEADEAAWLIVQHADRTPAFQAEMLPLLEERAAAGESSPRQVAYLWDRVAIKEGRPQRYGTQMECENGTVVPIGGLEDAARVEERRAAMRMQSYASYRQTMAQLTACGS
jgi:hypothetical protein